jgi:hypothetical protein
LTRKTKKKKTEKSALCHEISPFQKISYSGARFARVFFSNILASLSPSITPAHTIGRTMSINIDFLVTKSQDANSKGVPAAIFIVRLLAFDRTQSWILRAHKKLKLQTLI